MRIKLNLWQTILLFSPLIISELFLRRSYSAEPNQHLNFAIANLLATFNVALVVCYQAYLVMGFLRHSETKPAWFILNAVIPAIFTVCYFLYIGWGTVVNHSYNRTNYNVGPLKRSQLHGEGLIFLLFLLHAFVTFYFVNNKFVSKSIKQFKDDELRNELMYNFLIPMKLLIKVSVYVICSGLFVSMVIDMFNKTSVSK